MINQLKLFVVLLSVLLLSSNMVNLDNNKEYIQEDNILVPYNGIVRISSIIDLRGKVLSLPQRCTLIFDNGGALSNGTVVGNETSIIWSGDAIFDNVSIKGIWNVPFISSRMFKTLTYNNSLNDIIALSSDAIENTIILDKGLYNLSAISGQLASVKLKSNTLLINKGIIKVLPNDLERHYAIWCDNISNVTIRGGIIQGDRLLHKGCSGEWGYGICATRTKNLIIEDVEIFDCWGDCICLGVDNEDVTIVNCELHDSRRQGITIAGRKNIKVEKCFIYNILGTEPQAGIDIEPDQNGMVSNVKIDEVYMKNCKVGLQVYGGAQNVTISNITINNIAVNPMCKSTWAFYLAYADSIVISNCTLNSSISEGIKIENCSGVISVLNNTIRTDARRFAFQTIGNHSIIQEGNIFHGRVDKLLNNNKLKNDKNYF